MISFDDFKKLDLRVAKIVHARCVAGSEKLLQLTLSLDAEERIIIAGIGSRYDPDALAGRNIVIVANLEPKSFMGIESQGMLLAADSGSGPVLLQPDTDVAPGVRIR